jgi:osmotically-inducible protein OsmY
MHRENTIMHQTTRHSRYPPKDTSHSIPHWMGYPRTEYGRYDPFPEESLQGNQADYHALEGAGRQGWDYDQNRAYAYVHGNRSGTDGDRRNHRGKGPRNYRRSDERILDDIIERIVSRRIDASDVDIRIDKGEVVLTGRIDDKRSRRALEDLVDEVPGVCQVENRIRLGRPGSI